MAISKKYVITFGFLALVFAAACYVIFDVPTRVIKTRKIEPIMFNVPKDRVRKIELKNGMHAVLFKNTALPKVLVQIAYDVGSYVEESGERGLAHLVEHMIFKGTDTLSESDVTAIARKYGASYNAFTSYDLTSYFFEVDKNNWQPFLPIFADCMQNARFDSQHLASEVKAVIQELKMYRDNPIRLMLYKALELLFPPHHPYHSPVIGYKEDLLSLSAERVKAFYKKYYTPDRATLFIVGDIDLDAAQLLVHKTFEGIKSSGEQKTKEFPVVLPSLTTSHTKFYEEITSPITALYWLIPGVDSGKEQLASVVSTIFAGGQASRLWKLLVDEKKLAVSVGISEVMLMRSGIFFVIVRPMPGKADECVNLIQAEIELLMNYGVTETELAKTVKTKSKEFFHTLHDYTSLVGDWIQSYFATGNELDVFEKVSRYSSIDNTSIMLFANTYLDPVLMHRMDMLPLPASKKKIKADAQELSDQLDKEILGRHVRTTEIEDPVHLHKMPKQDRLDISFPKPDRAFELSNALKVLMCQQQHTPLVTAHFSFKDSYYLDGAREGIALQVMMDMLLEGSAGKNKEQNVEAFEQHGASYEFSTSGITFTCLKQDFQELLQHTMSIIQNPTFPPAALEKIKQMTLEIIKREQDSPKAVAGRLLKTKIYNGYPFAWDFESAKDDIAALDQGQLKKLHEKFLCAHNITLAVVGDIELAQAERMIKQSCESLAAGARFVVPTLAERTLSPETIKHNMLRDQTIIMFGRPSPVSITHPDYTGLRVLSTIAFDSLGSRIFQLRERSGLFYTASGAFASGASLLPGFDQVGAIISPENVETVTHGFEQMLQELATDGVQHDELNAARTSFTKDIIDIMSDTTSIARTLCKLDAYGLGFDYYDKLLKRLQELTVDDLNMLAKKYSSLDGMTRVLVGRV